MLSKRPKPQPGENHGPILATCGKCKATHFVGPWVYEQKGYTCKGCGGPH